MTDDTDNDTGNDTGLETGPDSGLDLIFAAARANRPAPSADLMARVLADAFEAQPAPATAPAVPATPPATLTGGGIWQALGAFVQALGGRGAVAGLGTAAIAGVWLGYSGTTGLDWLTSALLSGGLSDVEMIAADDLFLSEG